MSFSTKLFLIGYGIVYLGFFFHESEHAILFGYSLSYIAILVGLTGPFFIPRFLKRLKNTSTEFRQGALIFSCMALLTIVIVEPFVSTTTFDPFTNLPAPEIPTDRRQRQPGEMGLLVIGISTSKRYPPELETFLNRDGHKAAVISQAQMAMTIKHQLITYVAENRDVDADVAIVMFGTQSLFRSFTPVKFASGPYKRDWSHNYGEAVVGHRRDNIASRWVRKHLGPVGEAWASSIRYISEDYPLEQYISRADYRRYYQSLLKSLVADGRRVLVCGELFLWKPDMSRQEQLACWITRENAEAHFGALRITPSHQSLARAMRDYNRIARETALEFGCDYLDTENLVPRNLQHFKDDIHLNEAGRDLLIRGISKRLSQLGWLN